MFFKGYNKICATAGGSLVQKYFYFSLSRTLQKITDVSGLFWSKLDIATSRIPVPNLSFPWKWKSCSFVVPALDRYSWVFHMEDHTRGQVFLCTLAFIKRRLEIQKVKHCQCIKENQNKSSRNFLHNPSTFKLSLAHVCIQAINGHPLPVL